MEPIVEVTQADREVAADLVVPHGRWPGFPADFRSGRADANALTQAFARHRLSTPSPDLKADNAALVEAWRPIESAPKDGKPLLLARAGEWVVEHYWSDESEGWYERNNHSSDHWGGPENYATHWMPMPSPPAALQATEPRP